MRSRKYSSETSMDGEFSDNLTLLVDSLVRAESLPHCREPATNTCHIQLQLERS